MSNISRPDPDITRDRIPAMLLATPVLLRADYLNYESWCESICALLGLAHIDDVHSAFRDASRETWRKVWDSLEPTLQRELEEDLESDMLSPGVSGLVYWLQMGMTHARRGRAFM